jgi:hypothetical protein
MTLAKDVEENNKEILRLVADLFLEIGRGTQSGSVSLLRFLS